MRIFWLIRISNHRIPALRRPSLVPLWLCAVSSSGAGYLWWRGEGGLAMSLFPANCDDMGGWAENRNKQPLPATSFLLIMGVNMKHMPGVHIPHRYYIWPQLEFLSEVTKQAGIVLPLTPLTLTDQLVVLGHSHSQLCWPVRPEFLSISVVIGFFNDKQTSSVYELMSITNAHALSYAFPLEFLKESWTWNTDKSKW